jgi:hypothetical protein
MQFNIPLLTMPNFQKFTRQHMPNFAIHYFIQCSRIITLRTADDEDDGGGVEYDGPT